MGIYTHSLSFVVKLHVYFTTTKINSCLPPQSSISNVILFFLKKSQELSGIALDLVASISINESCLIFMRPLS